MVDRCQVPFSITVELGFVPENVYGFFDFSWYLPGFHVYDLCVVPVYLMVGLRFMFRYSRRGCFVMFSHALAKGSPSFSYIESIGIDTTIPLGKTDHIGRNRQGQLTLQTHIKNSIIIIHLLYQRIYIIIFLKSLPNQ